MNYVNLFLAACGPLALIVVGINRWQIKKSIGGRSIQFVLAAFLVPSLVILAREKLVDGEVIATLFGALIGFSAGVYKQKQPSNSD
jgi:hypothetical protein